MKYILLILTLLPFQLFAQAGCDSKPGHHNLPSIEDRLLFLEKEMDSVWKVNEFNDKFYNELRWRMVLKIDSLKQLIAANKGNFTAGRMQDTAVFMISNEMRSTWWRPIDHNPFPRILIRVTYGGTLIGYLKKMRHGWQPLPAYYKVWNQ